jgi:Domain of unknown function (DUF929)
VGQVCVIKKEGNVMAKTKQRSGSAVQRREQVRQQRQERLNTEKVNPGHERKRRGRKRGNNPWPLVIGILLMCAIVVGAFVWLSSRPTGGDSKAALNTITHIDPSLLDTVGAGSAQSTFKALPAGANIPQGAGGKPSILYIGADYCPYCAAQRWALIGALSRFGTFGSIQPLTSSESSIPTFSFHNSTYTSNYVSFTAVETADNQGSALEPLNAAQTSLMNTYDSPPYTTAQAKGSIPFLMIGNKLTANGAFYDPQVLTGLTYDSINSKITDSTSTVSRAMLGATNDLTAAICQVTNNQPTNVCSSSTIKSIEASLPQPSKASGATPQLASAGTLPDMIVPTKQD